jgi:hypothetical protein
MHQDSINAVVKTIANQEYMYLACKGISSVNDVYLIFSHNREFVIKWCKDSACSRRVMWQGKEYWWFCAHFLGSLWILHSHSVSMKVIQNTGIQYVIVSNSDDAQLKMRDVMEPEKYVTLRKQVQSWFTRKIKYSCYNNKSGCNTFCKNVEAVHSLKAWLILRPMTTCQIKMNIEHDGQCAWRLTWP